MTGYTPLFSSLTTGTLCGRWPDVGLWPIVLSLADRHGVVDVTPAYISGITGLALEEVIACMRRFGEPDPYSRSSEVGGVRLVLVDPERRDWGWRIVNHGKYREKARKAAYDANRTESGRDADRKRQARATRDVPTRPDASRAVPLSDKTRLKNKNMGGRSRDQPVRTLLTEDEWTQLKSAYPARRGDQRWKKARAAAEARLVAGDRFQALLDGATRYARFCSANGTAGGQFVKQAATFFGPERAFAETWEIEDLRAERSSLQKLMDRRASIPALRGFRDPKDGEDADRYRDAQDEEFKRWERESVEGRRT
jgi:hypothetical protein